jgi:hypothetical protein
MRWATRAHCHVDRTACAWLIQRVIDPSPEFVFVDDAEDVPSDATPFDIAGAELSHHEGNCTFEVMLANYGINDPLLWQIGRMVHEADIGDERFDVPEAPGLDALIRGLSMVMDDASMLKVTDLIFDGLYEYLRRASISGRLPS